MLNESLAEHLAGVRQALAESHRAAAAARQDMASVSARTESTDGSISLTLDAAGRIMDLTFKDDSYQDLSPQELAAKLVAVFAESQDLVRRAVLDKAPRSPMLGLTMEQLMDPETDVAGMTSGLLEAIAGLQPRPDRAGGPRG
jgi:hypothetical protein